MRQLRARLLAIGVLGLGLAALSACNLDISNQAEARDQWKKTYTLAEGGLIEIGNTNGEIQIEPGDGNTVEVTADKVARASTDQAAQDALKDITIKEDVSPNHISLDSRTHVSGFFSGSRTVNYHIRAPRWANVKISTTNGDVRVVDIAGAFDVSATNGHIEATGLENRVHVETTNGEITLDLAKLGPDGVSCETTNGAIALTIPKDAGAQLSARVTNGDINTSGLTMSVTEQSHRRLDGKIGAGGPTISLQTTNGEIGVKSR